MDLSQKLILLRKERGWTQAHAAKNITIQQSYLSKLENGHFVPSQDVIEKLCDAYNVTLQDLVEPQQKQKQKRDVTIWVSVLFTISFFLILSGQFSLFFSETYYNYKAQPISKNTKTTFILSFHITDQYLGESYIKKIDGTKYQFVLDATREVKRKENKWFTTIGVLIILSIFTHLLLKSIRGK